MLMFPNTTRFYLVQPIPESDGELMAVRGPFRSAEEARGEIPSLPSGNYLLVHDLDGIIDQMEELPDAPAGAD